MKILINDQRKIFAIQKEFNEMYPFLKLAFFAKPNTKGGAPSKVIIKHPNKTLGECRTVHRIGEITIVPEMTVRDLENHFAEVFGLGVQILRKSGNVWLETSITENWTLEQQNNEGKVLSHVLDDEYQSNLSNKRKS